MDDFDQDEYGDEEDLTLIREVKVNDDPHGLIGQTLDDRYYIECVIGVGGMGVVYKGQQAAMDRTVAVKVLMPQMIDDESLIKRFQLEARAASRLNHPNTITVYDFGRCADLLYIVMEYLEGWSLEKALKQQKIMSPERVVRITSQVLGSLEEAHEKEIVHRDIKPDNIWLREVGAEKDFVKVLDFGVAKLKDPKVTDTTMTQAGMIFGTPKYMSPEQAKAKKLDGRSDLYSLGVVMYQALMGRVPFLAKDPVSILIQHVHDDPPPFSEVRPDLGIPRALEEVVFKSLEKDRNNRFANAKEMRQAVDTCLSAGAVFSPTPLPMTPPAPTPALLPVLSHAPSPSGSQPVFPVDPTGQSVWNMGAPMPVGTQGTQATEWVQVQRGRSSTPLLALAILLGLLVLGGIGYLIWQIKVPPSAGSRDEEVVATPENPVDAGEGRSEDEAVAMVPIDDVGEQPTASPDMTPETLTQGQPDLVDETVAMLQDLPATEEDPSLAVLDLTQEPAASTDDLVIALVEDVSEQTTGFTNPVRVRFQFERPTEGVALNFGDRRFEREPGAEDVWVFDLADGSRLSFQASANRHRDGDFDEDLTQVTDTGEVVVNVRLRRIREEPGTDRCIDPVTGLRDPYCRP